MRGHGDPRQSRYTLWLAPLKRGGKPTQLSTEVRGYELLSGGRCVFVARRFGLKKDSEEVFYYAGTDGTQFNLLDGIARPKPLDPEIGKKSFIEDSQTVILIPSGGDIQTAETLLCLIHYRQGDMRAFALRQDGNQPQRLAERFDWRRAIYIDAKSNRYLIEEVPKNFYWAEQTWLTSGGQVFSGRTIWVGQGKDAIRKTRLESYAIKLGQ